ncbi:TRAP transporter small permease subunit [Paracoccus onubensis]
MIKKQGDESHHGIDCIRALCGFSCRISDGLAVALSRSAAEAIAMPRAAIAFVRIVEAVNYRIGRIAMYLFLVLAGVLLWSVITKAFFRPALWTQEMAQFTMVGYFVLGGAYSLMLNAHVRMDLLYGHWSPRRRAVIDSMTVLALIFFLAVTLWGGVESTIYAFEVGERSRTVWRPYMAPIKIVICVGVLLMLLQSIAFLIRDIATLRGERI